MYALHMGYTMGSQRMLGIIISLVVSANTCGLSPKALALTTLGNSQYYIIGTHCKMYS